MRRVKKCVALCGRERNGRFVCKHNRFVEIDSGFYELGSSLGNGLMLLTLVVIDMILLFLVISYNQVEISVLVVVVLK